MQGPVRLLGVAETMRECVSTRAEGWSVRTSLHQVLAPEPIRGCSLKNHIFAPEPLKKLFAKLCIVILEQNLR